MVKLCWTIQCSEQISFKGFLTQKLRSKKLCLVNSHPFVLKKVHLEMHFFSKWSVLFNYSKPLAVLKITELCSETTESKLQVYF